MLYLTPYCGYYGAMRDRTWRAGLRAMTFSAAIRCYHHYGAANQLRTWHEVYVMLEGGHRFEYLNCHPDTGLLPQFNAERLR